jgi:hypothetical protein
VLDPAGIAVSTAADDQERPSVTSNGTDYFVAWEDWRSGTDWDIYGARVASDGTVLDPTPTDIAVSTAANTQQYPSVASNGTDYFVVWEDLRNGSTNRDIYGARVRASDGYLHDGPPDTGGIAVSTAANDQEDPSVASNGTDYFVAWEDYRSGSPWADIYGTRVDSGGTVLDPAGIVFPAVFGNDPRPSVASNGTTYLVVSNSGMGIQGARVTPAGVILDPAGIAVSTQLTGNPSNPSAASNGTDYFVAWHDWRSFIDNDIYGARVASNGTVLDPTPTDIAVSTAASSQFSPSAASNGTDYFVAWEDYRSGTDVYIYGARVAPDGTVLDPTGIAVSTAEHNKHVPSVASNGTDYFVAWQDYRGGGGNSDIYGTRVASLDGAVLDDPLVGIAVSTETSGQGDPSVASNGTDYFVAWQDSRNWATTFYDIYGARVDSDGVLFPPDGPPDTGGIAVSTAVDDQMYPSAASNGTDYFVVWMDERNFPNDDIYGARVRASDGLLLDDPPDTGGIAVSTAAGNQRYPTAASNGTDYFIVWEDYRIGTGYSDIYGARVTSAGTVDDPTGIAVATAASGQLFPSVASNGTDYFVVWEDYRNDGGCMCNRDIYGARVTSAAGTVLDPSGLLIQQNPYDDLSPAVAYSACGKYLVAYQRFYDDPNFQSQRVMARLFYDGLVPSCIVEEVSAVGSTNSLLVEDAGSGQVKIWWENRGDIMQYNIYEGDLDAPSPFYTHVELVCHTAGTTEPLTGYLSAVVVPLYVNSYFLVTECDTATEGTSGYDSDAVERDPALNTCGPHP